MCNVPAPVYPALGSAGNVLVSLLILSQFPSSICFWEKRWPRIHIELLWLIMIGLLGL
jgi:hypothetical protein